MHEEYTLKPKYMHNTDSIGKIENVREIKKGEKKK